MAETQQPLPLSLADLDNNYTAEEIQKQKEEETKAADAEKAAQAEKEKTEAEAKAKAEEEAKSKDSTDPKKEGESDDKGDENNEDESIDTPEKFYQEVDKRHGLEDFKVDYGDVDPLSPDGTYIREKAIIDRAQSDLENYIKENDPRGYAYLLHRREGKSDEDFFKTSSIVLPEYETFKNDVDLQKVVLENDLLAKGLDREAVDALVQKAVADKKLFEKADVAYKNKVKSEADAVKQAEEAGAKREQAAAKVVSEITSVITDIITNGKTSNIVIPDSKKAEFKNYVTQNLYFDGENFFLFKPLSKDNAAEQIQAEYFGFVKGNLSELVKRQATTQNAEQLRRRIRAEQNKPKSKVDDTNKGFIPLSEIGD